MKRLLKHQGEFVLFSNIKTKWWQFLFVVNLVSKMSRRRDTLSRTVWDSSKGTRPGVLPSISRIRLPFFCSTHLPAFDSPPAFPPGTPFFSPVSATLQADVPLFPFARSHSPQIFQTTPLWSLYYRYNHFCFPSIPSLSTWAFSFLTPLVTSAAPTIQPVLNRNALDITLVCLLSTQSARMTLFWFVGKGARVSKLAQNSLHDFSSAQLAQQKWEMDNKR